MNSLQKVQTQKFRLLPGAVAVQNVQLSSKANKTSQKKTQTNLGDTHTLQFSSWSEVINAQRRDVSGLSCE